MGRTRTTLAPKVEKEIAALAKGGATAKTIVAALRAGGAKGISERTVSRRVAELRGRAPTKRARRVKDAAPDSEIPESPDAISEGTTLEQLDVWLARLSTRIKKAEKKGNIDEVVRLGRLSKDFLDLKRKLTPVLPPDPNEQPDMKKLAEEVALRLHRLIDHVLVP